MGERTQMTNSRLTSNRSPRRAINLGIDIPLLLIAITLVVFGLIMLYSASWDFSYLIFESTTQIFSRQLIWLAIGIVSAIVMSFFDYRFWKRLALPLMATTIIALLLVFFIGETRLGAVRALNNGSVQPSELAKLAMIIYLAVWLNAKRDRLDSWGFGLIPLGIIIGLVGALIFLQPDLSATITIFLLGGLMFFLAGGDLRQIALLVLLAVFFGGLIVNISTTGSERVSVYLEGREDLTKASYHVQRSLGSFANGGWFGVGIGKAENKLTGLPVPPTDSIFAVIGEETGVVGSSILVLLYLLFLWRCLEIARNAPDDLGRLLAAGAGIWIVLEALINMSVIVGLLPFAGNALPFISSGGSNLIVTLTTIGMLLNISRLSNQEEQGKEHIFNAIVDLRRRDRRRRVSRPRRSASHETG